MTEFDAPTDEEIAAIPPEGNLLACVEQSIVNLSGENTTDTLLEFYEKCRFYEQVAKVMRLRVEEHLIAKIKVTGPIIYGNGTSYDLRHPKKVECLDVRATIDALAVATGGEETAFLGCFSKNCIKHGAAAKVLSKEAYVKLFKVTWGDKLETGEDAPKKFTKVDSRFIK